VSPLQLTLLVGRVVATPAPSSLMSALRNAEVTASDRGPSGFQLQFELSPAIGRSDFAWLTSSLLLPFNRVVLVVTLSSVPRVIMDGLITHHQLMPGSGAQPDSLVVTGEDVSVAMDQEEKSMAYPGMNDSAIVEMILAEYVEYGLVPVVFETSVSISNTPEEVVNQWAGTDRGYVNRLARRNGYIFQVQPGPLPLMNTAYFGPPMRVGAPHKAITINQPPGSNVESLHFSHNALLATLVSGAVQDTLETDRDIPVETFVSTRMPPLAQEQPLLNFPHVRVSNIDSRGLDPIQALAKAQAITDQSTDDVLTAQGELDVLT
jgi:hypothetical protein